MNEEVEEQEEDKKINNILTKIHIKICEYRRDNYGNYPTWVILDTYTRHILKASKEYIIGGHIDNDSNAVNTIKGLNIAQADCYRGTIIEVTK